MKELIVDIRPYNKDLVTTALESGVNKIIIPKGETESVHKLGKIQTISEDGDLILGEDFIETEIKNKEDEERIVNLSKDAIVVVKTNDWKIIPLENLVSKSDNIYTTSGISEIKTMLGVLEKGVKGIVIKPTNPSEIKQAIKLIKEQRDKVELVEAKITKVKPAGSGDRSCVDTCSIMEIGEGLLVGNSSNFLFLVHAESIESEYCATRPFRVNAGAVHMYVMMGGNKTKYLSELESGDEVLVVNSEGESKTAIVGRNKIEERPMMVIEAEINGKKSSVVLQNAETIRLVQPGKKYISVHELKVGDTVLVKTDNVGRHFGQAIDEKIIE